MGYYFCLKKLERISKKFYFLVMESGIKFDISDAEKKLLSAEEISEVMVEMRSVFKEERLAYIKSQEAYDSNLENGYYDKGFGIIEGWFYKNIYLAIHFRRFDEYFAILDKAENLIALAMTRLRFHIATKK